MKLVASMFNQPMSTEPSKVDTLKLLELWEAKSLFCLVRSIVLRRGDFLIFLSEGHISLIKSLGIKQSLMALFQSLYTHTSLIDGRMILEAVYTPMRFGIEEVILTLFMKTFSILRSNSSSLMPLISTFPHKC